MKNRHRVNRVVSKYLPTGGGRKILKQGEAHAADVAKLPELLRRGMKAETLTRRSCDVR